MKFVLNAATYSHGVAAKEEILHAMEKIDSLHMHVAGRDAEFTSIVDGIHSSNSRHYVGLAADLRFWYLNDKEKFVQLLKAELGPDYFVLLEDTHIHISFKPRRQ